MGEKEGYIEQFYDITKDPTSNRLGEAMNPMIYFYSLDLDEVICVRYRNYCGHREGFGNVCYVQLRGVSCEIELEGAAADHFYEQYMVKKKAKSVISFTENTVEG